MKRRTSSASHPIDGAALIDPLSYAETVETLFGSARDRTYRLGYAAGPARDTAVAKSSCCYRACFKFDLLLETRCPTRVGQFHYRACRSSGPPMRDEDSARRLAELRDLEHELRIAVSYGAQPEG
jgi:hypothetical protein